MKLSRFILPVLCATLSLPAFAQGVGPNYETRLATLEDTMRSLNGQIEQTNFAVRKLDATVQRMQGDIDARLTKLENQQASIAQAQAQAVQAPPPATQPPPAPTAVAAQEPVPDVNGTLGAMKLQNGKVVGGSVNPKAPPLPDTPPDYGLTPEEQYQRAFDILRKADYPNAEQAFKTFIEKNPKDKLLENAKYWYGESLYVQNKYDEAAVAFVDAYQQNPKGGKAPDCLLKLGLSLSALNKVPDACTTLTELKVKYPNASVTVKSRAAEERTKLKCAAPAQ